jgi:hypothetical protein
MLSYFKGQWYARPFDEMNGREWERWFKNITYKSGIAAEKNGRESKGLWS